VRVWLSQSERAKHAPSSRLEEQTEVDTKCLNFNSEETTVPNSQGFSSTFGSPRSGKTCRQVSGGSRDLFGSEGSPTKTPSSLNLSQLPHRVLDLRCKEVSFSADICLLNNATQYYEPYFALSHRWSTKPSLKLTTKNFDALCKNISFQSLSRTFQDAVVFCRLMKVHYLWIDALCIKQDDEDDWRKESISMGHIYENAKCVIMAHITSDGFLEKSLLSRASIKLDSPEPSGGSAPCVSLMDSSSFCINNSPLSIRGWVFQERMLAKRAVHFMTEHILMEDMGNITSEHCPDQYTSQRDQKRALFSHEKMDSQEFCGLWAGMVEDYSACELTQSKDKIPAISGLAKVFSGRGHGQHFLAGLWSENLSQQFLWVSTSSSAHREQWRAPSWSWASLDGTVKFLRVSEGVEQRKFTIEGFWSGQENQPRWVDGPCLLAVRGSVVEWDESRIQGETMSLRDGNVCVAQNSDHFELLQNFSSNIQLSWSTREQGHINGWVSYDTNEQMISFDSAILGRTWTSLKNARRPPVEHRRLPEQICMRVCSYAPSRIRGRRNVSGKKNHLFLILRRVQEQNIYTRIGVGEIFINNFFDKWVFETRSMKFLGNDLRIIIT